MQTPPDKPPVTNDPFVTLTTLARLAGVSPAKVSGLLGRGVVSPDAVVSGYFQLFRRDRLGELLPLVANAPRPRRAPAVPVPVL